MKVAVITNEEMKQELLAQGPGDAIAIKWLTTPSLTDDADCYIDLLFEKNDNRINALQKSATTLIIVNAASCTAAALPANFVCINAWPGFLKRALVEATGPEALRTVTENIFSAFQKKITWLAPQTGFVSTRVVSMIINEAYLALDEKISSKEEIDTAMKLGTNYPYGPFEWAQKIGLKNIYRLLQTMSEANDRYQPAALLKQEAFLPE